MASITIRRLDDKTKTRLRVQAAHHGRSMEEEARNILSSALHGPAEAKGNFADTVRKRFATLGGVNLQLPPRGAIRRIPTFTE